MGKLAVRARLMREQHKRVQCTHHSLLTFCNRTTFAIVILINLTICRINLTSCPRRCLKIFHVLIASVANDRFRL